MTAQTFHVDEELKKYATEAGKRAIDAVNQFGSMRAASRELGINFSSIHGAIETAKKRAAMFGYAPAHDMRHVVPEPYVVKGVSTYYNKEGEVGGQWVKSKLDHSKMEQVVRDFVASLIEDAKGTSLYIPPPAASNDDLLVVYPIGDPHFGMYSWKAETGADFDTDIAEKLTIGAVDSLVASAPPASTAIIAPLGDVMHADDAKNRTPQSGHILDVDTRHQRVIQIALRAVKHCIYRALEKHKTVIVRVVRGNHDPHAAFAIALALKEHFSNNERVTIDLSPSAFWFYRFDQVLIGITHGDTAKGADLLGVMATDRAEDWGQTKHRYFYHGHLHHKGVKEVHGLLIEWFQTLAPADAWASAAGYRAGRGMEAIVHHRNFGEVGRHRCDISMIQ